LRAEQGGVTGIEEVDLLDGAAVEQVRLGQAVEGTNPGRETIQGGQVRKIALVTSRKISRRSIRL
jgi:hypothetical protein